MKCVLCGKEAYIAAFDADDAICDEYQNKEFNKNTKTKLSDIPYAKRIYSSLYDSKTGQWCVVRIPGRGIVFENFPNGYTTKHCGRNSMTAKRAFILGCPDELFELVRNYKESIKLI